MVSHRSNERRRRVYSILTQTGIFIGIAAALAILRKLPNDNHERPNAAKPPNNPLQNGGPEITGDHHPNGGWHPDEKRHRSREWWYWKTSIVFSSVAMVAAIAAAIFTGSSVNAGWKSVGQAKSAMIEDDRAWVGAIDAGLTGQFASGQSINGTIDYENFGKEPATNVTIRTAIDAVSPVNWFSSDKDNGAYRIQSFVKMCLATPPANNSMVVFPTTNFETLNIKLTDGEPKPPFDSIKFADVANGNQIFVLSICFIYTTFGVTKHTTSCFFYQAPGSNMTHLNICPSAYAD